MNLSIFCQTFKEAYGGGNKSIARFFETLISFGLTNDKSKEELEDLSDRQKRNIFNGSTDSYTFCLNFIDGFGQDTFKNSIDTIGEEEEDSNHSDIIERLCLCFKVFLPDINKSNCSDELSKLIYQIFKNEAHIALENKKKKSLAKRKAVFNEQCGKCFRCHRDLILDLRKDNHFRLLGSNEDTIAVCPTCYQEIKNDKNKEKDQGKKNTNHFKFNYDLTSDDLIDAISELEKMGNKEINPQLNYSGLKILQKINKDIYPGLFEKISIYVATYYPMMRQIFSEYDGEEGRSFERLVCNIRNLFLQVIEKEKNPNYIFDSIVDEIENKTGKTRFVSEIIVAFFIQNCEVFDEISK